MIPDFDILAARRTTQKLPFSDGYRENIGTAFVEGPFGEDDADLYRVCAVATLLEV
jgi:hypothetical protein